MQVCRGVRGLSGEEVVQTHNTDRRAGGDKVLLITTGDTGVTCSTYSASGKQGKFKTQLETKNTPG